MSVDENALPGNRARGAPSALPGVVAGVSLWWSDLGHTEAALARAAQWLSAAERARAARFATEPLRQQYIAGRSTLRELLGQALRIAPADVALHETSQGRPMLAAPPGIPDFNVSHTRGGAIYAIATGLSPEARIGVDVEHDDRQVAADGLAQKFLTADEQATLDPLDADARRRRFLRYWTCKEAMCKATGEGLAAPFGRICVDLEAGAAVGLRLRDGPAPYLPASWQLHPIAVPDGFVATLAIWRGGAGITPSARP